MSQSSSPLEMGKQDLKQPKLTFDNKPSTRNADAVTEQGASQQADDSEDTVPEDMRSILLEVHSSLKTIDSKIDALSSGLEAVKKKVNKHETRLDTLENRLSDTQDHQSESRSQITSLEKEMIVVKAKNEDLELRSRRNNVHILGLPESTAISRMGPYIENLLRTLFGPVLSSVMTVDRTHHSLGPRSAPGASPRPIIARLLNYADRDSILREARTWGTITHEGNTLLFFPDYTPAVQVARREFIPTKKLLHEPSIPFAMLYPAKLKVMHNGQTHFFTDAKSSLKFAKHIGPRKSPQKNSPSTSQASVLSDNE